MCVCVCVCVYEFIVPSYVHFVCGCFLRDFFFFFFCVWFYPILLHITL